MEMKESFLFFIYDDGVMGEYIVVCGRDKSDSEKLLKEWQEFNGKTLRIKFCGSIQVLI